MCPILRHRRRVGAYFNTPLGRCHRLALGEVKPIPTHFQPDRVAFGELAVEDTFGQGVFDVLLDQAL